MGYDIELHYCSSDPSSLDGIVIKELNVVMIDATAPHTVDPKTPGAIDEILNFGEFWDVEKIEQNRDKIKACNEDISEIRTSYLRNYYLLWKIYYKLKEIIEGNNV